MSASSTRRCFSPRVACGMYVRPHPTANAASVKHVRYMTRASRARAARADTGRTARGSVHATGPSTAHTGSSLTTTSTTAPAVVGRTVAMFTGTCGAASVRDVRDAVTGAANSRATGRKRPRAGSQPVAQVAVRSRACAAASTSAPERGTRSDPASGTGAGMTVVAAARASAASVNTAVLPLIGACVAAQPASEIRTDPNPIRIEVQAS